MSVWNAVESDKDIVMHSQHSMHIYLHVGNNRAVNHRDKLLTPLQIPKRLSNAFHDMKPRFTK